MKKYVIFSFLTLLFISGCAGNANNNLGKNELQMNRSAPDGMSSRSLGRDQRHLVERDITNQNPNFLNLDGTGSGTETGSSIGIDVDKARQVIRNTKEFTPGSVWINGNRMSVTAYKKGILTAEQRAAEEARLHRILVAALPRYSMEVKVMDSRR